LTNVFFTNANYGTVIGLTGTILRTTNGGATWTLQTSGTTNTLWGISFVNTNVGTVVGNSGTILRTTNGGTIWTPQSGGSGWALSGVSFTNSDIGTIVGHGLVFPEWVGIILRTTDGGTNWEFQTSGTNHTLHDVCFINASIGTAVGDGGTILRTSDGGQNWSQQVSGTTERLFGISFSDVNTGTGVGENGTILRTWNGGIPLTTFPLVVAIDNGWNIVSIPGLHPINQNVETWWSGKDPTAQVFKYSSGYQTVATVAPTEGYWVKHLGVNVYNTGDEWPISGIQIVPHDPINAFSGWNLIGGYENTEATNSLTTTPPGLIDGPVYEFSGTYEVADNLIPGYGYWIKLSGDGQINIPDLESKGSGELAKYFREDWGRIILTDNGGRNFTLYAVKGEVNLNQYELPPLPPLGMFDIRFSSGRIAEDLTKGVQSIEMSGIQYPVTVKVENISIILQNESGKGINAELNPGKELVLTDRPINKLIVLSGEFITPINYSLEQNYPNPFNPTTNINFSIPEATKVTLTIYNVLGEQVSVLVNSELDAGKYSYQWNASNIATGIYICELRTDKFVSSKKMILLK